jgi:phosphatidylinositol glycan class M
MSSQTSSIKKSSPSTPRSKFWRPSIIFPLAILFRLFLLVYGRWQDAHSPLKYTDIDYLVFTDAARFVSQGQSPYDRATYRYTPLLAWILLPTSHHGWWFEFGKALFAVGDVVAGFLIYRILRSAQGMESERALKFAAIWLLNPMVANISTRGSSEGLLAVIVIALLWAGLARRMVLAGALLGFAVHFKIYPFVYAASLFIWLGPRSISGSVAETLGHLLNRDRVVLAVSSFVTFMGLNAVMYNE